MDLKKAKNTKPIYSFVIGICSLIIIILVYIFFFTTFSSKSETRYVCIDTDDTIDSVFAKVDTIAKRNSYFGFRTMMRHSSYSENIHTGRYKITPEERTFSVMRRIKNGQQTPMNLTVPSVRTTDRLASDLSKRLMLDSASISKALTDEATCKKYGYDTTTIACMFIPNTYEVFWDLSIDKLLERMQTESKNFWTKERQSKARALNMNEVEVITLASIIDEETANNAEKPMIAGMYYNRLQTGMPLQADPTIKFARKDFAARRIYHDWLTIDSPYNTYKNTGLPPGPIRIPSVAGIDAVLDLVHHNYLYMCAKEDFSGTHNFAVTYAEHLKNAAKYSAALNARGIH